MSVGDAIRRLIDPLDPTVAAWLRRELPRLVAEGLVSPVQAEDIAHRYGVRLDGLVAAPATTADMPPVAPGQPPATAPDSAGDPSMQPGLQAGAIGQGTAVQITGQPSTVGGPPGGGPARPGVGQPSTVGGPPGAGARPAAPSGSPFFAENAISIVLYLGAFLVVTAAVIFLAYSWGDISGGAKLASLAILTAGFLGAAALCLPRPAIAQAGRTFLAVGAILVPANIAALYLVYFEDGPFPAALFWLIGAMISGGFHALLSARLGSVAYGALAVLAVPIGAAALAQLIDSNTRLPGLFAAGALVLILALARTRQPIPLVRAARGIGSALLPLTVPAGFGALGRQDAWAVVPPLTLVVAAGGLAWEATRRGKTWWIGPAGLLVLTPVLALAIGLERQHLPLVVGIIAATWIAGLVGRRLERQHAIVWDAAALLPALVYPLVIWDDDGASALLLANLAGLSGFLAWTWRTSLPLYAGMLAVDIAYAKLLDIYGSPDSPEWTLGVALLPLGVAWAVLGVMAGRRGLAGPPWVGALLTLIGAALAAGPHAHWSTAIAATAAVATFVAAWRLHGGPVLLLAVPWLLYAGYRGAEVADLTLPWRFAVAGLTGWLPFAVSLVRPPATSPAPVPATAGAASNPEDTSARSIGLPSSHARGAGRWGFGAAEEPHGRQSGGDGPPRPARGTGSSLPDLDWALCARLTAVITAGLGALLVSAAILDGPSRALLAASLSWASLALTLAAWAWLARSHPLALVAALGGVPVLVTEIARFEPRDAQVYAIPVGAYLLAVAWLDRRSGGGRQRGSADAIAAVGLVILLGTGLIQSFDRARITPTLLTLAEGLALLGVGIGVRWRVLVVGGVAGTVLIALRQLFDAVAALPGWALLGGSGMLLLGIAVALLLARARLAAAGRAAAERWSSWS